MTSTTETSGIASVISASKKLAVALVATVLAVIVISAVTISIAVQGKNDANNRADRALVQLDAVKADQQCRSDLIVKVSVATIRNARSFNGLLLAISRRDLTEEARQALVQASVQDIAHTQAELDRLEQESLTACPDTPAPR